MPARIPITPGERFWRLVVVEKEQKASDPRQGRRWRCRCDCGGETLVRPGNLRRSVIKSCGCGRRGRREEEHGTIRMPFVEGAPRSKHPLWQTWNGMIQRCCNPKSPSWNRYGGRGIKVCERWSGPEGFANFCADMGPKPTPEHSLDRWPDNDADYDPYTTVWSTPTEQAEPYRGEGHFRARLTDDDVRAIRVDPRPTAALARALGVERSVIDGVRKGKTWRHVR